MEGLALLLGAGLLAAALWLLIRSIGRAQTIRDEKSWRPGDLQDAELAFAEKDFYVNSPDRIVARVDRVYRRPDQVHVLTELKRRDRPRLFESDRIELSVQRLAVAEAGLPVSDTGYVVVEGEEGQRQALPVRLLPDAAINSLARRFRDLMSGRTRPTKANHLPMCRKCAYQNECKPDVLRR
jgi:CRISPR/Cas system-associated exonuclease Cas4 (RecB family)